MKKDPIIFISFKAGESHGIGYLRSVLTGSGYNTKIIDIQKGAGSIYKEIKDLNPKIVGFSIIFQDHFKEFRDLVSCLREKGVNCHFTAGGHYASLRYKELFDYIPQLDSIVRFEGEYPMLELADKIFAGADWSRINGLVYKKNDELVVNPPARVVTDLDKLPFPLRPRLKKFVFDYKFSPIIAGRGCNHNCAFCNSKEYYRQMGGPLKRDRHASEVVREMSILYQKRDCRIFMFDDDDFPVSSRMRNAWIEDFCDCLHRKGLSEKVIWKINCRPDEITEDRFSLMRKHGLFHVFIGIEDGTDQGLKRLNKNTSADQILRSVRILKKLKIGFDFGFMLFQPETTFASFKENLRFLKKICGDGYTPVTFLKLIPLYETAVEENLRASGRLKVINGREDYEFSDVSMNQFHNFVMNNLYDWLTSPNGVVNVSQWGRNYFEVHSRFQGNTFQTRLIQSYFKKIVSDSNMYFIVTLQSLAEFFEKNEYKVNPGKLQNFRKEIARKQESYVTMITAIVSEFIESSTLN